MNSGRRRGAGGADADTDADTRPTAEVDAHALAEFCSAKLALDKIERKTAAQRQRMGASLRSTRELLRDQMSRTSCNVVQLTSERGETFYAHLKPKRPQMRPVAVDDVMQALKALQYDSTRPEPDVDAWIECRVRTHLERTLVVSPSSASSSAAAAASQPTLSVTKRPPRNAFADDAKEASGNRAASVAFQTTTASTTNSSSSSKDHDDAIAAQIKEMTRRIHPLALTRIQETGQKLLSSRSAAAELRKSDDDRRKQLKQMCAQKEPIVSKQLVEFDPEYGARRLRLVDADNKEMSVQLRSRTAPRRPARHSVRTVLPIVRKIIRKARINAGLTDASLTYQNFHWLVSSPTMRNIQSQLEHELQEREKKHDDKQPAMRVTLVAV